ncbi:DUF3990 domain-containing protein [Saccharibacillus sp. JS10]|nr:DUF3990 domain-containing protein [Saccharibacillus sp. JS10]
MRWCCRVEAKRKTRNRNYVMRQVRGIVLTYEIDINAWNLLNGRRFERSTDSWREFVYNNRISQENMRFSTETHNQYSPPQYDIVYGPLADGQMADLTRVEAGELGVEDFLRTVTNIGSQISIHTDAAKTGLKLLQDGRYFV